MKIRFNKISCLSFSVISLLRWLHLLTIILSYRHD
jgi:hypothetical protein